MQLAKCYFKHQAKHYHETVKTDVSPAEVLVLRALHGDDAVTSIEVTGKADPERARNEFKRLTDVYGKKDENVRILSALFPGARPILPATFSAIDAGADLEDEEDAPEAEAPAPAARRTLSTRKATEAVLG
jgi:hypothetical protein